jgi:hypothetical protein
MLTTYDARTTGDGLSAAPRMAPPKCAPAEGDALARLPIGNGLAPPSRSAAATFSPSRSATATLPAANRLSGAAPVFVLAWGARTGSTWLARLLTSTGGILMWGEEGLFQLLHPTRCADWTCEKPAETDLYSFRAAKHEANLSRLLPFADDLEAALARFAEGLFGGAAAREGYRRWGKKEIDWDLPEIEWLRKAWPHAKVVYLYRDFRSVFASALGTGWFADDEAEVLRRWLTLGRLCLKRLAAVDSPNERLASYRQLTQDHAWLVRWCGLPPCRANLSNTISTSVELSSRHEAFCARHRREIEELEQAAEGWAAGEK